MKPGRTSSKIVRGAFALAVVAIGVFAIVYLARPHRRLTSGLHSDGPRSATTGAEQRAHGTSSAEVRRIAELKERVERMMRVAGAAARAEQQATAAATQTASQGDRQITMLAVSPIAPDEAARMQAQVDKTIRNGGVATAQPPQEDPAPILAQIAVEDDPQRRFRLMQRYVEIAISFPPERQADALAALVDTSTKPD